MRIKCYYNKNLKMSAGKLAAQVGHVVIGLCNYHTSLDTFAYNEIVVLQSSPTNLRKLREDMQLSGKFVFTQVDMGLTEVAEGTETVIGWVED